MIWRVDSLPSIGERSVTRRASCAPIEVHTGETSSDTLNLPVGNWRSETARDGDSFENICRPPDSQPLDGLDIFHATPTGLLFSVESSLGNEPLPRIKLVDRRVLSGSWRPLLKYGLCTDFIYFESESAGTVMGRLIGPSLTSSSGVLHLYHQTFLRSDFARSTVTEIITDAASGLLLGMDTHPSWMQREISARLIHFD